MVASDHVIEDQSEVAAFLARPATYGPSITNVERIDTHGAMVFLAGRHAYKIKRAVRFPYMDFSTLERRRRNCEREVALNRRTAPGLYIGVVPITRQPNGHLAFAGNGSVVEWAVAMRRFDQDGLFDRLAAAGALSPELLRNAADAVARFHAAAESLNGEAAAGGGHAAMRWVVEENIAEFGERPDLFPPATVIEFRQQAGAALDRVGAQLDRRLDDGFVRRCHGDLHLRNICDIDGRPTLFDAIEFNDRLAAIDVLYDLAFLLMDLEHQGLAAGANLVLNRTLQRTGDFDGLAALPLFLSTRAAVRAKVSASAERGQHDATARRWLHDEAGAYFRAAQAYLRPRRPCLIAIGGVSGTGKSTLARALAPDIGAAPGAVLLRSDALRKALFGVGEAVRLPASAYTPAAGERVYRELLARARAVLSAGHAVIADATFLRPEMRHEAAALARARAVPFRPIWLEAPRRTLDARVAGRRGDASDATTAVVANQLRTAQGEPDWPRLDADHPPDHVAAAARALLPAACLRDAGRRGRPMVRP